jgi:hypothetical protein
MNNPKTLAKARELRYMYYLFGEGSPYKEGLCCASVSKGSARESQCVRKATSGPFGFHCKQHGRMIEG